MDYIQPSGPTSGLLQKLPGADTDHSPSCWCPWQSSSGTARMEVCASAPRRDEQVFEALALADVADCLLYFYFACL